MSLQEKTDLIKAIRFVDETTTRPNTPKKIKKILNKHGVTLQELCAVNQWNYTTTTQVLNKTLKGTRGKTHEIAVKLGLKLQ